MNTKHLKAKILDLAIRGKLVPQDSSEGNAADLLQKIRDEKSELVKQKKIKEDKNASFIIKADDGKHYEQFADGSLKDIEDEIPFEVPENWCWCRFSDCSINRDGERKPVAEKDRAKLEKQYNYIGATGPVDKIDNYLFDEKLLLIGEDGANLLSKNKNNAFIVDGKYWVNNHAHVIDASDKELLNFFCTYINAIRLDDYVTGSAQPKFTQNALNNLLIPLPPLSEQKRIVSAIEKAFEQIDIIEKNKLSLKTYIKQTKSKVLDLAIHGKLVEQNPQEGNAFELLEKIRNEKAELIKQKKLKEDKNASFIIKAEDGKHYEQFADGSLKDVEEEIPFEIPENWCWCRLRDIGTYKKGPFGSTLTKSMFVPKSETTVKVYEQQNAIKKNHNLGHYYIKGEYFESDMKGFEVHPGDILVSCAGTIGETYILPDNIERGIINQALMKMTITKELNIQYFLMYFDHILKSASDESGKGTAMKNIPPFDVFKQFLFPLPPLSEQKRIVAKIEQVFEQLDVLGKSLGK